MFQWLSWLLTCLSKCDFSLISSALWELLENFRQQLYMTDNLPYLQPRVYLLGKAYGSVYLPAVAGFGVISTSYNNVEEIGNVVRSLEELQREPL